MEFYEYLLKYRGLEFCKDKTVRNKTKKSPKALHCPWSVKESQDARQVLLYTGKHTWCPGNGKRRLPISTWEQKELELQLKTEFVNGGGKQERRL